MGGAGGAAGVSYDAGWRPGQPVATAHPVADPWDPSAKAGPAGGGSARWGNRGGITGSPRTPGEGPPDREAGLAGGASHVTEAVVAFVQRHSMR